MIHQTPFKNILNQISKLLSYAIVSVLYIIYFVTYFIVKPNVVDNTVDLIFICSSFFMNAFVKSISGELRPFMLAKVTE